MQNKETLESELVKEYEGLVHSQASFFYRPTPLYDLEDLVQVGYIGLIKAIRYYDENKSSLETFATYCIRNEMLRFTSKLIEPNVPNKNGDIYTDECLKDISYTIDDTKLNGIQIKILDLLLEGKSPSEIKNELNLNKKEYQNYFDEMIRNIGIKRV